jgi:hypothetical protein
MRGDINGFDKGDFGTKLESWETTRQRVNTVTLETLFVTIE